MWRSDNVAWVPFLELQDRLETAGDGFGLPSGMIFLLREFLVRLGKVGLEVFEEGRLADAEVSGGGGLARVGEGAGGFQRRTRPVRDGAVEIGHGQAPRHVLRQLELEAHLVLARFQLHRLRLRVPIPAQH